MVQALLGLFECGQGFEAYRQLQKLQKELRKREIKNLSLKPSAVSVLVAREHAYFPPTSHSLRQVRHGQLSGGV